MQPYTQQQSMDDLIMFVERNGWKAVLVEDDSVAFVKPGFAIMASAEWAADGSEIVLRAVNPFDQGMIHGCLQTPLYFEEEDVAGYLMAMEKRDRDRAVKCRVERARAGR